MFRRRRSQQDFQAELQTHLELEAASLRADGVNDSEAQTAARRRFGNVLHAEERFYRSHHWLWLDHLRRDVTYALRLMKRNPGLTFVAVASLALGIGVNALVFSVVNALVLRPLPVDHPEQLQFLQNNHYGLGQSFPTYRQLRDSNQAFSGLLGYRVVQIELDSPAGAVRSWGYLATGNYFDVLGVRPLLGRFFHQDDDQHPGASPYAVLSYRTWQSRFGGDRQVVGKTMRINRQSYTILGVAPPEFHGTEVFYWPELWVPMMMQAQIEPGNAWLDNDSTYNTWLIGRLKPGVSSAQAVANLNNIAREIARIHPQESEGLRFSLSRPGLLGDIVGGPVRAFSLGVLLLAGLVLVTACANLAGSLMARGADRQREIAIRLSVGASRFHVQKQVLTEALLLATLGGLSGLGLSLILSNVLSKWHAPLDFPVQFEVTPDWRVFLFAVVVSLITGILFGIAPARSAARTDANTVLKGAEAQCHTRKLALRDILVVVQVAVCFVLVSACLVSVRGLQQMLKLNLGFEPHHVVVAGFDLGLAGYTPEKGRAFQEQVRSAVTNLPGVTSVAFSNSIPLSIDDNESSVYTEDRPNLRPSDARKAVTYEISPQFFEALGTAFLAGRTFNSSDRATSPRVAVVNHAFGKQVFGVETPLGRRFRVGPGGPLIEVIGVVQDGKYVSPTESRRIAIFLPESQSYNSTTMLLVRSSLPDAEMLNKTRETVAQFDPDLPLFSVGALRDLLGFAFFPARAAAIALSAFGILSIMLALTGVHGLVSFAVARRTHEIGIRVAVGAGPRDIARLVLGRIFALLAAGSACGLLLAIAGAKWMTSIVVGVAIDPTALFTVIFIMIALGLSSSWPPTRRALRVDPTAALRHG